MTGRFPWLEAFSISDREGIQPFAEFGIVLLLFAIGLELSFRRLMAMRKSVFGVGAAELFGGALLIGAGAGGDGQQPVRGGGAGPRPGDVVDGAGPADRRHTGPVGRAAFAMLLFEDLALVPLLFLFASLGGAGDLGHLFGVVLEGRAGDRARCWSLGRLLLPPLFAQAARTKSPELFLAVSLLTVILASLATSAVGLSPILGALIAGVLIAETEYRNEVELVTAPFRGLALGVFLITVGMSLDLPSLISRLAASPCRACRWCWSVKAFVTGALLRLSGSRPGVAAETGLLMASPSETTLILLGAGAAAGVIAPQAAAFWQAVTALGLTVTPLLATARPVRGAARRPGIPRGRR